MTDPATNHRKEFDVVIARSAGTTSSSVAAFAGLTDAYSIALANHEGRHSRRSRFSTRAQRVASWSQPGPTRA